MFRFWDVEEEEGEEEKEGGGLLRPSAAELQSGSCFRKGVGCCFVSQFWVLATIACRQAHTIHSLLLSRPPHHAAAASKDRQQCAVYRVKAPVTVTAAVIYRCGISNGPKRRSQGTGT